MKTRMQPHNGSQERLVRGTEPRTKDLGKWDRARAMERMGGNQRLLEDVLLIFLQVAPAQLELFRNAIATRDTEAVRRLAHQVRGELGCLALLELSADARQLEEIAQDGDLVRVQEVFSTFENKMGMTISEMRLGVSPTNGT